MMRITWYICFEPTILFNHLHLSHTENSHVSRIHFVGALKSSPNSTEAPTSQLLGEPHRYPHKVLMELFEYKKQVTPLIKYKQLNQILVSIPIQMFSIGNSLRAKAHPTLKNIGYLTLHLGGNYNGEC